MSVRIEIRTIKANVVMFNYMQKLYSSDFPEEQGIYLEDFLDKFLGYNQRPSATLMGPVGLCRGQGRVMYLLLSSGREIRENEGLK